MLRQYFRLLFFFQLLIGSYQVHGFQMTDTLANYLELKIYSGIQDTIFISHPRYFGLFAKDSCTTENYGTTILTNSGCWKRIHQNFSPRYWALGGPTPDYLIGQSVVNEVDAINSAAFAAFQVGGDTIEIDSMYDIDRSVHLFSNNTYLGTSDSCGFRRIDPPVTILTDTAKFNDNQLLVESNSGFRKFQKINIASDQAFDSLAGFVAYTASISIPLGGDTTIFLSGLKVQKQMLPGDSVGLFFPMMTPRFNSLDSIHLKNLVFDGNREKYTLNYDWRINPTLLIPTTNKTEIEECRFYRIPNENIFLCGATFKGCSGTDLNGSILHFSCNDFDHPTTVLYNHFSNTNQVGNSIMKHSEAGLTFSAKVQNLRVAYNDFQNISEHGIGIFRNDDRSNEITDNLLNSTLETIEFQPFYQFSEINLIYNNKNLNFIDDSIDSCWLSPPQLVIPFACQANSSENQPLTIGDTIKITLDSFLWRNSNANFVKAILPVYQEDFFSLANMKITVADISQFHQWIFDQNSSNPKGLVFDNGHKDGLYALGNWGYEPCAEIGKCSQLDFYFIVKHLPDSTSQIDCPLKGIRISYDGELGSWNYPITCFNTITSLDSIALGKPFLEGNSSTTIHSQATFSGINIFPNPSQDYVHIHFTEKTKANYQILNSFGSILQSESLDDRPIFVGNLSKGVYLLKIIMKNRIFFSSFIKL